MPPPSLFASSAHGKREGTFCILMLVNIGLRSLKLLISYWYNVGTESCRYRHCRSRIIFGRCMDNCRKMQSTEYRALNSIGISDTCYDCVPIYRASVMQRVDKVTEVVPAASMCRYRRKRQEPVGQLFTDSSVFAGPLTFTNILLFKQFFNLTYYYMALLALQSFHFVLQFQLVMMEITINNMYNNN